MSKFLEGNRIVTLIREPKTETDNFLTVISSIRGVQGELSSSREVGVFLADVIS